VSYDSRILLDLAKCFIGPIVHCELAFVEHSKCDAFLINLHTEGLFPQFVEDKVYTNTTYHIEWYKIKDITYSKWYEARTISIELVNKKQYQISTKAMGLAVLPKQFETLITTLVKYIFHLEMNTDTTVTQIQCAHLCSLVLSKVIDGFKPIKINQCPNDLLLYLLESKMVELIKDNPFGTPKIDIVRDVAGIQRAYLFD